MIADAQTAAATIGRPFEVLRAGSSSEIDAAFARLAQMRVDGLLVAAQPLFTERRVQIATLAVRHSMPMMSSNRQITEVGGLMSYGTSTGDQARQVGLYVGRILKGEKPADLPVMRSTKFDLVINLQTAKTIGLTIPPTLLALADGVIE
jgi:putative ABC transport system substrate-binding protein